MLSSKKRNFSPTLLAFSVGILYFLSSCQTDCKADKTEFLQDYQAFIQKVRVEHLNPSSKAWDEYDLIFRKYSYECYQKHESAMNPNEKINFWIDGLCYVYVRYSLDLLRKFQYNDELILHTQKHVTALKIDVPKSVLSQQKHWVSMPDTTGEKLQKLQKIFKKKKTKTWL